MMDTVPREEMLARGAILEQFEPGTDTVVCKVNSFTKHQLSRSWWILAPTLGQLGGIGLMSPRDTAVGKRLRVIKQST